MIEGLVNLGRIDDACYRIKRENGWTDEDLARAIGLTSRLSISNRRKGKVPWSLEEAANIAALSGEDLAGFANAR